MYVLQSFFRTSGGEREGSGTRKWLYLKSGKRAGLYVDGRDAVKGQMLLMKEDRTAKRYLHITGSQ